MKTVDLGTIKYRPKKKARAQKPYAGEVFVLLSAFLLVGFFYLLSLSPLTLIEGLLKPVSVFSQVIGGLRIKSDDGRTNLLLLGLDKRKNGEGLTDTILIASLDFREKKAVLVSLPRDLWVRKLGGKINMAYALGGIQLAKGTVEKVLGVPVHYFGVVDFIGFEKAVNILGGVEVNVERSFDDYFYPIPGKENDLCGGSLKEVEELEASESAQFNFPCRFEHIYFKRGLQLMDGEKALKFVRSRHAEGEEGSDLARAKRQQKMLMAIIEKSLSLDFLINSSRVRELLSTFSRSVETNVGPFEVERLFRLGKEIKAEGVKTVVLNSNLLFSPQDLSLYGNQWVLLPKRGDFSEVQAYVQRLLFGEEEP